MEDSRTAADWISFRLPAPTVAMRERLWTAQLAQERQLAEPRTIVRDLASAFQLTDSQIRDAAAGGARRWRGGATRSRRRSAPTISSRPAGGSRPPRLVAFAQRIEPRTRLTLEHDVVLPTANKRALAELQRRIRNHRACTAPWGSGPTCGWAAA